MSLSNDLCQFKQARSNRFSLTEYNQMCNRYLHNKAIALKLPLETWVSTHTPISHPPSYGKATVVLVHGFLESTFSMLDMANSFIQAGYGVQTVLLPGHGGIPQDLKSIKYASWERAIHYVCDQLSLQQQPIIIAGMSMGATLALECAYSRRDIQALVLISAALDVPARPFTYNQLFNTLKRFALLRPSPPSPPDHGRYSHGNIAGGKEALKLIKKTRKISRQHNFTLPIFGAVSMDDETIEPREVLRFFERLGCTPHQCIVYSQQSLCTPHRSIDFVYSPDPAQRIIDYGHAGLHIAPEHPIYGAKSSFRDYRNIRIPNNPNGCYFGAATFRNQFRRPLARLRYNPKFHSMMQQCLSFIKQQGL